MERPAVRIELDIDDVAGLHVADLALLEVRDHVGLGRHQHEQRLAGANRLADVRAELRDGAARRRGDGGIRAVELRARQSDLRGLDARRGELARGLRGGDLLIDGRGLRDAALCLGYARLGHALLLASNPELRRRGV